MESSAYIRLAPMPVHIPCSGTSEYRSNTSQGITTGTKRLRPARNTTTGPVTSAQITDNKNVITPLCKNSLYPNREFIQENTINEKINRRIGVVTSSYFLKKSRMEFLTAINPVIRFLPFLHRSVYLYYRHDLPGTYLAVPV